jgi:hypothetical protein
MASAFVDCEQEDEFNGFDLELSDEAIQALDAAEETYNV